jgi:arginyl-tRNA synthetase
MDYAYFTAKKQVEELLCESARLAGYDIATTGMLRVERSKAHGFDLASPVAFAIAKDAKKSPSDVASSIFIQLRAALEESAPDYIDSAEEVDGYIDFRLSQKYFLDSVAQAAGADAGYGANAENAGKLAIVEYSSPNVGKPMHIGHIRSTILGDVIANLHAATGYKVVRMNYLCDAGAQVASLLLALKKWGMEKISSEKDLLAYYVDISKRIGEDPALKAEEQEMVAKMEAYDPEIMPLLMKARELTIGPFEENYRRLGIKFDTPVFDSDFVPLSKAMVDEALEKGVAKRDEKGEVVGILEGKYGLPNLIILRSNGTTLYSTRDMGFAQWRWDTYHFDRSVIVTASEQNLHFRQVLKLLGLLGREYAARVRHVGFGLLFLEGGVKLSSRKGQVLLLDDVLDEAIGLAKAQIKKEREYSQEDDEKIAAAVGIGAVKFAILRVSAEKNISFSIEKAVSFEGDTGAYLQYTAVRAGNILLKAGAKGAAPIALSANYELNQHEKALAALIAEYPLAVKSAASSVSPHSICDFALKLASAFSVFYVSCPVIEAPSQESRSVRLALVGATLGALSNALGILGIVVPEKM